jgi:prepilin-type N-terminal cleavage/methylation domain-containing protein
VYHLLKFGIMGTRSRTLENGFTLLELLVVISIIGLLASVVLASMGDVRGKARDARRKEELRQISLAIEMYYAKYENYPRTPGWCTQISNPANNWGPDFQNDISEWLPSVPLDPKYHDTYQDYFYRNIGDQSYYLYAELEEEDNANDGFTGCARIGGQNNEYDYRYPVLF